MTSEEDPRPPEEVRVVYPDQGDEVGSALRTGLLAVGCAIGVVFLGAVLLVGVCAMG